MERLVYLSKNWARAEGEYEKQFVEDYQYFLYKRAHHDPSARYKSWQELESESLEWIKQWLLAHNNI